MAEEERAKRRNKGRPRGGRRPGAGGARGGAPTPAQVDPSTPLTVRPPGGKRREPPTPRSSAPAHDWRGRRFDAVPDRVDLRDWPYQPYLVPLPDVLVNCDKVPRILDQKKEGACTGFALAAVINYLLHARGLINPRQQDRFVSPRMLYEMARRYDEWPGEDYVGSSARGAMMGWVAHGVCRQGRWPDDLFGADHFDQDTADEAQESPGGAFFRVSHREVRDMHAALHEVGALYVTLMVHDGWFFPGVREQDFAEAVRRRLPDGGVPPDMRPRREVRQINYSFGPGNDRTIELPVIQRIGRAESGHAVALVGYTPDGFIVQNSWGRSWGTDGFSLLPYEDYLLHATDVWVAQLGVPVRMDLWSARQRVEAASHAGAGIARAVRAIPLNEIRPFVIDIGNDGRLSDTGDYFTTESDLRELVTKIIPTYARENNWTKRRVLLYLHGGLNDERAVAARIVAFRDVFLANQVYPVHIMWETGWQQSLANILNQFLTGPDARAGGVRDWLDRYREGLVEAKDRSLEVTLARPGRALWDEMKENADLASNRPDGNAAMELLAGVVTDSLNQAGAAERASWELHVIGHSAGSIFAAYAMQRLLSMGIPLRTLQFFAPAITTRLFTEKLLKPIRDGRCPFPSTYVLSDAGERDDSVGPYGKSLLYLVSNAFEPRVGDEDRKRGYVPLLGMYRFLGDVSPTTPGGEEAVDKDLRKLFQGELDGGLKKLVIAGAAARGEEGDKTGNVSESRSHGGFDNDYQTMNSALFRILGAGNVVRPFTTRDLQY